MDNHLRYFNRTVEYQLVVYYRLTVFTALHERRHMSNAHAVGLE
jgi:hypothetical protein